MGLFGNKSEYEKTYEKLQNEHSGVIALSIEEDNFELVVFQGEQITKTHPQNSYGWEIMGDGYLNLEKFENAIECYEKAISLGSPNFFLDEIQLAMSCEGAGKIDDAIEHYEYCLKLDPNDFYERKEFIIQGISLLTKTRSQQLNQNTITDKTHNTSTNNPLQILKTRLANGEITTEEYKNLKSVLEYD